MIEQEEPGRALAGRLVATGDRWAPYRLLDADGVSVAAVGGPAQAEWRPDFDAVADDLRSALGPGARPGPDGVRHLLARSLGRLAYAQRYLAEARGHFARAAGLAPGDGQAAADLLAQAQVAAAEGLGELAFDLLHQ